MTTYAEQSTAAGPSTDRADAAARGSAPPGIAYAGIGDEAGRSLDDQLAAVHRLGWNAIELRTVGGTAVADLDADAFASLADRVAEAGVRVVCVDSRIADWSRPVTGPFEQDLAELRVLARRLPRLGTRYLRVMSYPNAGLPEPVWREEAVRRMRALAGYAEEFGVVLLHENCAGWAGTRAERALELLARVASPALRLLFDTGNGVPHGYDAHRMLLDVVDHVEHVHIKDAVRGPDGEVRYTLPGLGRARVAECLRTLLDHGWTGAWSIEPHLALRPHEGRDDTASDGQSAFAAHGRALQRLVDERVLRREPAPGTGAVPAGSPAGDAR